MLKDGDIVNVDVTSIVNGWHGDQSETFLIGEVSDEARAVTQCAFDCLHLAIKALYPGCPVSVIGDTIVEEAMKRGFPSYENTWAMVWDPSSINNQTFHTWADRRSRQERLLPGTCFTVEPMINVGSRFTRPPDKTDGWTVRTRDSKLSAQFEHTILMTENWARDSDSDKERASDGTQILVDSLFGRLANRISARKTFACLWDQQYTVLADPSDRSSRYDHAYLDIRRSLNQRD